MPLPRSLSGGIRPPPRPNEKRPRDRHVLAAAVRSHSELIVTYNRRHFPAASVEAWEIDVQAPSAFLRGLYDLDAGLFVGKLHEQAAAIGVSIQRLLLSLSKNVPGFVDFFCEEQGIPLPLRFHPLWRTSCTLQRLIASVSLDLKREINKL